MKILRRKNRRILKLNLEKSFLKKIQETKDHLLEIIEKWKVLNNRLISLRRSQIKNKNSISMNK